MQVPDPSVVAVVVAIGVVTLGIATWLAIREPLPSRGGRVRAGAPLVPWLGSAIAVLLAIRGAWAGAGFVLLAMLVHAALARWRALAVRRRGR